MERRGLGNQNPQNGARHQVHFVEAPVALGHLGPHLPEGRQLLHPFTGDLQVLLCCSLETFQYSGKTARTTTCHANAHTRKKPIQVLGEGFRLLGQGTV